MTDRPASSSPPRDAPHGDGGSRADAPLSRETALEVVRRYGEAWEKQDPSLIVKLFTRDASYHEQIFNKPIRGRKNIGRYWNTRVVRGQKNVKFNLLNLYVDGSTAIAEWEAQFEVVARNERLMMRQVAILDFAGTRIRALREYWTSKKLPKSSKPGRRRPGGGAHRSPDKRG